MRDLYQDTENLLNEYYSNATLGTLLRKTKDIAYLNGDYFICLSLENELISLNPNNKGPLEETKTKYLGIWKSKGLDADIFEENWTKELLRQLQRRTIDPFVAEQLIKFGEQGIQQTSVMGLSIDEIELYIIQMNELYKSMDPRQMNDKDYICRTLRMRFSESILVKTRDYYRDYLLGLLDKLDLGIAMSLLPSNDVKEILAKVSYEKGLPDNYDKLLSAICNALENLLSKDGTYINIDEYMKVPPYNLDNRFISNEILCSYRTKLQCYRHHSNEKAMKERAEFSENNKIQFIRMGVIFMEFIINHIMK